MRSIFFRQRNIFRTTEPYHKGNQVLPSILRPVQLEASHVHKCVDQGFQSVVHGSSAVESPGLLLKNGHFWAPAQSCVKKADTWHVMSDTVNHVNNKV